VINHKGTRILVREEFEFSADEYHMGYRVDQHAVVRLQEVSNFGWREGSRESG
jgi:hypothetical protein